MPRHQSSSHKIPNHRMTHHHLLFFTHSETLTLIFPPLSLSLQPPRTTPTSTAPPSTFSSVPATRRESLLSIASPSWSSSATQTTSISSSSIITMLESLMDASLEIAKSSYPTPATRRSNTKPPTPTRVLERTPAPALAPHLFPHRNRRVRRCCHTKLPWPHSFSPK